jgi:2-amino-4-hydroxy-6-hydroxymethyldihydropteridine diphosphokinase
VTGTSGPAWHRAFLGLGANLGDRLAALRAAAAALAAPALRVAGRAPIYETRPQGPVAGQPDFLNSVLEVATTLEPLALLDRCRAVEAMLGRRRERPGGPRTMDIDLLLYGDLVLVSARLTVPHPRLAGREFVLRPLLDLAPDLRDPRDGRRLAERLAEVAGQGVRPAAAQW